jgi:hypothetical protein
VLPFVKLAERQFKSEVGAELYAYLNTGSFANGSDEADLLELAQAYVAWTAYDLAFPHLKLRIGDMGMMKTTPANTIAVTKWEYVDSREANLQMAELFAELFWQQLEELRPEQWKESDAYKQRNLYFISSAAELKQYVSWLGRNSRLFQKLLPYLEDAEENYLRKEITDAVFDGLKTKLQDADSALDTQEKALLKRIKKALALQAVELAMPYLPLAIDEKGIREIRKKDGTQEEEIAEKPYRNRLLIALRKDTRSALTQVLEYLDANATDSYWASYYTLRQSQVTDDDLEDFTDHKSIIL